MPVPNIPDDALLSTKELSAAFASLGLPVSPFTLTTKRSRGGGPPFKKFDNKIVRYRWGTARDWRMAQGRAMSSTSAA